MSRLKVLVVQPSVQPPGGGNAVAAWMLQALAGHHDLTVLTWSPVDLEQINEYYGTQLRLDDATWRSVAPAVRVALEALPIPIVLLKASLLFRHAKRLVADFDVVVCGHNETDLGPRTVQYIHYPTYLRPRPEVDLRWYHEFVPVLDLYYGICDRIAGFRPDRVLEATTLTNSSWIAERMVGLYGEASRPRVVPPPVEMSPSRIPWSERANGFVCIGRISPEKELERVIRILSDVRAHHPSVELHIIGSRGPSGYVRTIERAAAAAGEWVQLHFDAPRAELVRRIHENRYAIHGMSEEHFGIAPAEAMLGGCIVFVPDGGGQVDIVGEDVRLRFSSSDDAAEKIAAVLASPGDQVELVDMLGARAPRFTRDRFETDIRSIVAEVGGAQRVP